MEDLFDFEEDLQELIINNNADIIEIPIESTVRNGTIAFSCCGEDSSRTTFVGKGLISNMKLQNILSKDSGLQNDFNFFGFTHDITSLTNNTILEVLFMNSRKNIQKLIVSSRDKGHKVACDLPYSMRLDVTSLIQCVTQHAHLFDNERIAALSNQIRLLYGSYDSLPNYKILYTANSTKGNQSISPSHHLFHGFLEWRYFNVLLKLKLQILKCEADEINVQLENTDFDEEFKLLIYDLMVIALCKYDSAKSDIFYHTAFPCTCVKELWLQIQILNEYLKQHYLFDSFWNHFNFVLDLILNEKNYYTMLQRKSNLSKNSFVLPGCKNDVNFAVWLLAHVAKLQGFDEKGDFISMNHSRIENNYVLVDKLLKLFVVSELSEENCRKLLVCITPIILEWWIPKADVLMSLWEHFHKKINSPFFILGSSVGSLAVTSATAAGYLEQLRSLLETPTSKLNLNQSSYSIFLFILHRFIQKNLEIGQKSQVQKILSRIYLKFSATKMVSLNETGIHNVINLFLILSMSTDLKDINLKLLDMLLQIPLTNTQQPRQISLVKGHIAMLLLHSEQNLNMKPYLSKFMSHFLNACDSSDATFLPVLNCLVQGIQELFSRTEKFELEEHLLLDYWLLKYLSLSTTAEQDRMLEILNDALKKVQKLPDAENASRKEILSVVFKYVLPFVKQKFAQNEFSHCLPDLAANICLCANGLNGLPKFEELLNFFLEISTGDVQTKTKFLVIILQSEKLTLVNPRVIIRNWLRYSVLSTGNTNPYLKDLKDVIVNLSEFQQVCLVDRNDFLLAKEPISVFMNGIGKKYNKTEDFQQKLQISEKLQNYLSSFSKWATNSQLSNEMIMKVYSFIAIIILHCPNIVYIRSKSSCFFNIAMSLFILPSTLLMGKSQPQHVVLSIIKIWHVLIEGISKLDYTNDSYLIKILDDMVVKWIPQLKIFNNSKVVARPLINLLNGGNVTMINVMMDKFMNAFILLQARQANPNACLGITIIEEMFVQCKDDPAKLEILLKSVGMTLLEHAMMVDEVVPSKKMILDFLQQLCASSAFVENENIRSEIVQTLKTLTTKHLSYYTSFYFQFMFRLLKVNVQIVRETLEHLKNHILTVEQEHGVGRDSHLRTSYENLETAVASSM